MPLVRPSNYVALTAPTTVTSPDGRLTAMVDTTWDGVLLKLDYSSIVGNYPAPFTATIYRQNPDGSVVAVRSADPTFNYSGVCYAYDHEAPLGRAVRYYAVPNEYSAQTVGVINRTGWVATASDSDPSQLPPNAIDNTFGSGHRWQSGTGQYNGMYFQVAFGVARVFDTITLDTGPGFSGDQVGSYSVITSNDGLNWGPSLASGSASGQLKTITFASPVVARFCRILCTAASGNWWTIDEINFSSTVSKATAGQSNAVVVTIPARAGGAMDPALWLKSISNPSLSMRLNAASTGEGNFAGMSSPQIVLGSAFPSATYRQRQARATTITVYTFNMTDFDRMTALVDSDVIMLQSPPGFSRKDGYYLIGKAQFSRYGTAQSGIFQWNLELTQFDRPPTANSPLEVPGFSFEEDLQDGDGVNLDPNSESFAKDGAIGPYLNLLPGAVGTLENGISDWAAFNGNTTISQSVIQEHDGNYALRLLSGAAGNVGVWTAKRINIAAGQTYTWRAWFWSPVSVVVDLEIDYYNAAGAYIDFDSLSETIPTTTIPAATWTQVSMQGTAVTNAVTAVPYLIITATAGSQAFYVDGMELIPNNGAVVYQNQLSMNMSSMETSIVDWQSNNANTTVAKHTGGGDQDGTGSLQMTSVASGAMSAISVNYQNVTGGKPYRLNGWLYNGGPTNNMSYNVLFYDANNNLLQTSTLTKSVGGSWNNFVFDMTSPATATKVKIRIDGTATAAAQQRWADLIYFGRVIGGVVGPANIYDKTLAWAPI